MWIERVVARAFGPLKDATLDLSPGMTVISGPNEAGKTSWQVATRLALTGLRRGPGQTKAAAALIERHRPWDQPDRWEVEARLHLADGRTIEISQDLLGKVACRARDVDLGEDVSHEIINDGTPDASVWLGLDRDAFSATASVNQAQILAVAESAASLQEQMQRAAATRGTDATAAEAIEHLKTFRKDAVGADTVVAKGPLRGAMREQEAAEVALADARRRHVAFLERSARLESAERQLDTAQRREQRARAATATAEAKAARERADRASALSARNPQPPAALEARDVVADQVAAALAAWQRRPAAINLNGPSTAEIEARLAALPDPSPGDRRPADSVLDALRMLDLAEEALRIHRDDSPVPEAAAAPRPSPPLVWWLAASTLGLAGGAAMLVGQVLPGAAVLAVAGLVVAASAWSWMRSRSTASLSSQAIGSAGQRAEHGARLAAAVGEAQTSLGEALLERSAPAVGDLRQAAATYSAACLLRQQQAEAAAAADGLRQALSARRALEETAELASQAALATAETLRVAATEVGMQDGAADSEALVAGLLGWQGARATAARERETAILEWQELEGLLAGANLADVETEAAGRAQIADRLSAALNPGVSAVDDGELSVEAAKETVDALKGELGVLRKDLPEVTPAEERVDAARADLDRIRTLADVIDEAVTLLESAERRVHRDLAPVLRASIQRWLPVVSEGGYIDAAVNPRDLSVEVKESSSGQWRDARLLSEGTREQIYLLLRVAMAEHLVTTPGEVAPLLLDEVTVQSDAARKRQLLDVLHTVSADRQVILFSHDAEVIAWARDALVEPRDRLVRLGGW